MSSISLAAVPDLLTALRLADRTLGEAREMLKVFEDLFDIGDHDELGGKGCREIFNQINEARAKAKAAISKAMEEA